MKSKIYVFQIPKELLLFVGHFKDGEKAMVEEERLAGTSPVNCSHEEKQLYTERCFDILNGLELTFTRCLSCHKIVGLQAKKFESR